jgi:hypothetical protein
MSGEESTGEYKLANWTTLGGLGLLGGAIGEAGAGGTSLLEQEGFEILDGVRRAKIAEQLGMDSIPAIIEDINGNMIGQRTIPLDSLHSPHKEVIDVSNVTNWDRYMDAFNLTKSGSPIPPIRVNPGFGH